MCNKAQTTL